MRMKCGQCLSEIPYGSTVCPICGKENAPIQETIVATRKFPSKSRGGALLVAWIGMGLFLWKYLGDDEKYRERLHEYGHIILWSITIIGLPIAIVKIFKLYFSDLMGVLFGTLTYSDGTEVW